MRVHSILTPHRLDGLNKTMRDWDVAHYGRIFNGSCRNAEMPIIQYPEGWEFNQIVRS